MVSEMPVFVYFNILEFRMRPPIDGTLKMAIGHVFTF